LGTIDGSNWRLKSIIVLTLLLTLFYGAYGVFGDIQTASEYNEQLTNYSSTDGEINASGNHTGSFDYGSEAESGQSFIDVLGGFGSFLTFGEVDNTWARMILNTFTTICFIVIGFLIYTFIRDWIPFI